MKRRTLMAAAAALPIAATLPDLTSGRWPQARAQGSALRGMHFGGPYAALDRIVGKPFADAGHGTITYSTDTTPGAFAKLEANPKDPVYDVFLSVRSLAVRYAESGLLAKISPATVPNLASLAPASIVPGNAGAAMVLEYFDLMYDKSKVRTAPTSWLDLWRPEFAGRIALHSSATLTPLYLIAVYTRAIGSNEKDPAAVKEAFEKYAALKKSVRVFTTDPVQVNTMMDRGEIDIGVQFGIRISALAATNANVARATPKEGVPAIPIDVVIAQNSPRRELAQTYLNFVLSPEIQLSLARTLVATPSNPKTPIDADLKGKILSDYGRLIYFDEAYLGSMRTEWLARWQREVQS